MKKAIAMLLAFTMAMGLVACSNNEAGNETTTTAAAADLPESALEILETVWGSFAEDEKFPVMGGDFGNMVDGAPGAYSLEDVESLTAQLVVPADQATNVTEAAALFHGMMVNNFTAGAFRVADAKAFAETMHGAIANNRWMCGFPEQMVIATIGDAYVVTAFGLADVINSFQAKLTAAYPEAVVAYSEAVAG